MPSRAHPTILREKRSWMFWDDEPGVVEEKTFRITRWTRSNECPQTIDHPFPARRAAKEIHGDEDIARVLDRFDIARLDRFLYQIDNEFHRPRTEPVNDKDTVVVRRVAHIFKHVRYDVARLHDGVRVGSDITVIATNDTVAEYSEHARIVHIPPGLPGW